MIIFIFAMLNRIIRNIFDPSVNIDEIIIFINKLTFKILNIKFPSIAENTFIITKTTMVFIKLRFIRFRFRSIEIFIIDEIRDIKK